MITNIANVLLIDKAATPLTHTYTPASRVAENVARWVERSATGIAMAFNSLTFSIKEPSAAGGVFRHKMTMADPQLDLTIPTAPKLLGTAQYNGEFIFPDVMSDQNRKDFVQKVYTAMGQGSATALGDNIVLQALPY